MDRWMTYALAAFTIWGVWGFLSKLASRTLNHRQLVFFSLGGYLLVFITAAILGWGRGTPQAHWRGALLAVAAGMASGIAYVFFYLAIGRGEASRIVTITALYPVVTAFLAVLLLREPVTLTKAAGTILAVGGLILLAL
jgi:bacterial/archaeal transporter family protein